MYVRKKNLRKGDKTYSYWQLVQSTWVDGKSRQTVVKHLGALADWIETRESATRWAKMHGLMCGAKGCGRAGTEEKEVMDNRSSVEKRVFTNTLLLCSKHAAQFRREGVIKGALKLLKRARYLNAARP